MLFNVIGNAIYYEKTMKKELDSASNDQEAKQALMQYICTFFGFFTHPLYPKQIEQVRGWLKNAPNYKQAGSVRTKNLVAEEAKK